tara:strand:+ start:3212 stop:3919 length:708 start_codon:yes stop_codon:yes gene_type:complete
MGKSKDLATRVGIDDNADATAITIDSSENVGIGATSLSTKLEVADSNAGVAAIRLRRTDVSNSDVDLRAGGGSDGKAFDIHVNQSNRMRIDGLGAVTKLSQPCFAAYNYSADGATLATHFNPIRWANIHSNVGNCFNNTTGRFTFPVTGKYLCFCNINLKATDAQWLGLFLLYNTGSSQVNSWGYPASNSVYENVIISSIVSGTANDTIAFTYHNSYSAPSTNNSYNMAYIYLLG